MPSAVPEPGRRRKWRLALAWSSGALLVSGLAFLGYMKLVEGAWLPYNKWDRRERGALRVGQQAPDLELPLLDQGTIHLAELWPQRPAVLIFGSCT